MLDVTASKFPGVIAPNKIKIVVNIREIIKTSVYFFNDIPLSCDKTSFQLCMLTSTLLDRHIYYSFPNHALLKHEIKAFIRYPGDKSGFFYKRCCVFT